MTDREVKKKVRQFRKKSGIAHRPSSAELKRAVERMGYTVIEFNNIYNDDAVAALIEALHIPDRVLNGCGFTYAKSTASITGKTKPRYSRSTPSPTRTSSMSDSR